MKLLLSNDDGIDSPGLQALFQAASNFGEPIVVAPAGPQSGVSHTVTFEGAIVLEERMKGQNALYGTPADCARVGLLRIVPDAKWVLSGINHGGNLGADIYYSGTVAAVREAVLHGWPGIALSHHMRPKLELNWPRTIRWVEKVLGDLLNRPPEPGLFYNVNLPHLTPEQREPEIVFCPLDPHPLPLSYRHDENGGLHYNGIYSARQRKPGADVDVCFNGDIAITELRLF